MNKTYYKKRNDFSESHYKLPKSHAMFDIDVLNAKWLDLQKKSNNEDATYVEYRVNSFDHDNNFEEDRISYVAMFELKFKATQFIKNAMKKNNEMNIGGPLWAAFMTAKKLNSRFFLVIATEGKAPFYFFEYCTETNIRLPYKQLNYDYTSDNQSLIRDFWRNKLKIK